MSTFVGRYVGTKLGAEVGAVLELDCFDGIAVREANEVGGNVSSGAIAEGDVVTGAAEGGGVIGAEEGDEVTGDEEGDEVMGDALGSMVLVSLPKILAKNSPMARPHMPSPTTICSKYLL